jgi:hypothetical protein
MAIRYLSGINVDSNTLFVDDANNRVGIGTASPTQALDVTGRAYISSGASIGTTSTAGTGLTVNGSTVLLSFVEIQQGNLLYLYSSGNTYYSQIYQSGQNLILSPYSNVGIGTTSPAVKFVVSNAGASGFEVDPTGGVGGGPVLQAYNRSTSAYMAQSYYALSHTFNVGSGGSTRAVDITSAGDVAINTTDNALAKLRVVGNGAAGNSAIMADYGNTSVLGEVSMISYRNSAWHTLYVKETGSSATNAVLVEGTKPVIFNAGDVGIGTTSPASKLDVYGIISLNGYNVLQEFGSNNVYANVRVIRNTSSVYGDGMYVNYNSVGTTSAHLRFFANGTSERMRIDASTGNVGIGTTSPVTKLHVVEDSNSSTTYPLILNNRNNQAGDGWGAGLKFSTSTPEGGGNEANKWSSIEAFDVNNFGSSSGLSFTVSETYTKTKAMVITRTGAVGIGTTSPSQKLHVVGVGRFDNIGAQLVLGTSGVAGAYEFSTTTGNALVISLSGVNERMRIDSSGNVGIGTTSPNGALHVASSPQTRVLIENTGNDANGAGLIMTVRSSGTIVGNGGIYVDNSNNLILYNGGVYAGNERVRINNSGYVGINTTAPSSFLTVSPGGSGNAATFTSGANLSTNYVGITLNSVTTSGVEWYGSEIRNINTGGTPGFLNPRLGFFTQNASTYLPADRTEKMSILGNGNVGIGTTSPAYKLDVNGVGSFSNGFSGPASETGYRLKFYDNGGIHNDVGIGLDGAAGGGEQMWFNALGGFYWGLGTGGTKMRLDSNGNVGIGTTSPTKKLQIALSDAAHADEGILLQSPSGYGEGAIYHDYGQSTGLTAFKLLNTYAGAQIALSQDSYSSTGSPSSLRFYTAPQAGGNTPVERMRISSVGALKLNAYGSGSNTGTATQRLAVDASGNVIEIPIGSGPVDGNGTANYVTKWSDADTITNSIIYDNGTNVGVGTTSPIYKLHVAGSTYVNGGTLFIDSEQYLRWGNSNQGIRGVNDTSLEFVSGGSERMRITAAGNVGIGTTSPTLIGTGITTLDIQGSNSGGVAFGPSGVKNYIYGASTMYVEAHTTAVFTTSGSEKMRITSAGEVLIGTTTDSGNYKLQVNGRGLFQERLVINETANDTQLQILGNGTNIMSLQGRDAAGSGVSLIALNNDGGNVSIGTTAQLARTTILSDSSAQTIGLIGRSADNIATIRWWNNAGNTVYTAIESNANYTIYNTVTNGYAAFFTNNSERVRITSAGNVGIGTTSPATKLHVDASGHALVVSNDTGNRRIYFGTGALGEPDIQATLSNGTARELSINAAGGNVGIGVVGPSQKLHVAGNVRVTGAYYDSNNEAGTSGQVLSSTGSGTDWVTPATTTASSLYDLLPAARTTYDWTVQMTSGTWADIFSSNTVLSNGTWMVQVYVSDFASGGQQYQETYSGVMSWGNANNTNQGGASAISEVVLHRSGHAANAGQFYLRTQERASSTLLLQGMVNYSHTSNTTINFKFVKVF